MNIKVDREERPDIDKIYMRSVQMMTGRGGWPMTVFMTPEGKPFFGGTYFPPTERYGHPGFFDIIKQLDDIWRNDKKRALDVAGRLTEALKEEMDQSAEPVELAENLEKNLLWDFHSRYDELNGGFSKAPKFPRPVRMSYLLKASEDFQDKELREKTLKTLDMMAQGGMYDHVGGGFHRYSVDVEWKVPHFEKMLYDNAQLPHAYLDAWLLTKKAFYKKVVTETLDYAVRDMFDKEVGAFHSSEDAVSEKVEGKFYVWKYDELKRLIPASEFDLFVKTFGIKEQGNFKSHETPETNVLHIGRELNVLLEELKITEKEYWVLRQSWQKILFEERSKRVFPRRDDKILTSWNALMIRSLARAGDSLGKKAYLEAAVSAGEHLWQKAFVNGKLHRTSNKGVAKGSAYLDDYAYLMRAYIELYKGQKDEKYLKRAVQLWSVVQKDFSSKNDQGFYYRSKNDVSLIVRSRGFSDSAIPNANASLAIALQDLYSLTKDKSYQESSIKIKSAASAQLSRSAISTLSFFEIE